MLESPVLVSGGIMGVLVLVDAAIQALVLGPFVSSVLYLIASKRDGCDERMLELVTLLQQVTVRITPLYWVRRLLRGKPV